MSDQTIFNNTEVEKNQSKTPEADAVPATESTTAQETRVSDPYVSMLDTITTSDGRKKYATVSDALNSIPHKESHISNLENELKEMREELDKRKTVEASITEASQQTQSVTAEPVVPDEQQLEQLVQKVITGQQVQTQQLQNKQSVVSTLKDKYGDKAEEVYVAKAKELGVDPSILDNLALTSPSLVLSHFSTTESNVQPSYKPSLNVDANQNKAPVEKKKVLLGGASTSDVVDAWRQCKPE